MIKWITALLGYTYFRSAEQFWVTLLEYFRTAFSSREPNPFAVFISTNAKDQVQLNLLSLAIVIKADGKVDERELRFVRNYFIVIMGSLCFFNLCKI